MERDSISASTPIAWLGSFPDAPAACFGNKATTLDKLAREFAVPPGFAVPRFDVREGLSRSTVVAAYRELGRRVGVDAPAVAVRSSGAGEDSASASYAGMFDTYLSVTGERDVVDAVERCARSASTQRASAYQSRIGAEREGTIPVLVQRMVDADVSAVAFSRDPVPPVCDDVVIEAIWGLGEALVGGHSHPDAFRVARGSLMLRSRQLGGKEVMTVPGGAGTIEVTVPHSLRRSFCLEDDTVVAIARLALRLEHVMGEPIDLECVISGREILLLQCRPITAGAGASSSKVHSAGPRSEHV